MSSWFMLGWKAFLISLSVSVRWAMLLMVPFLLLDSPTFLQPASRMPFPHLWSAMSVLQIAWLAVSCGLSVALLTYTPETEPGMRVWAALPFYAAALSEFIWVPPLFARMGFQRLPWPTPPGQALGLLACAVSAVGGLWLGRTARRNRHSRLARVFERCRNITYRSGWTNKRLQI